MQTEDEVIPMIEKDDLIQVKCFIEACVGQKIQLKANKGRKKSIVREGIIENTYPSIFVIKFQNGYEATRTISYSYTDVLTKAVEIVLCGDDVEQKIKVS